MSFCTKCGGQNPAGSNNCTFCGQQLAQSSGNMGIPPQGQPNNFGQPPNNFGGQTFGETPKTGMGTASFILGIIGLVLSFCGGGLVLGILAIVFGALQNKQHKMGKATGGIVMGILAIVISLIMTCFWMFSGVFNVYTWTY